MSQSSDPAPSPFRSSSNVILLERNGELSNFARLLEELGLPIVRCSTGLPDSDQLESARLVLASAPRLVESGPPHLSSWPATIVVVQNPSKTLSAHLHRIGVSMILCEPVHPQALRLLLLHTIYRGPERRNRKRTPIGHPMRVGSGLFRHKATLLELSPTGARIEMSRMPKIGSELRIQLGKQLTLGRPLKLNTRVVRRIENTSGVKNAKPEVGVSILGAHAHKKSIDAILNRFAAGPATWKTASPTRGQLPSASLDSTRPALPPAHPARVPSDSGPIGDHEDDLAAAPVVEDEAVAMSSDDASSDRRTEPRIPYHRRIVALDEEAARVLVGHDLSAGGMRVDSNSAIAIDDVLRVALHCGTQMEPLVVMARVLRDDGDEGTVLGFEDLRQDQRDHLEKIIASSGPIRAPHAPDDTEGEGTDSLVVGELLETIAADSVSETDCGD